MRELRRLVPERTVAVPSVALAEVERLAADGVAGANAALAWARTLPVRTSPGRGDAGIIALAVRRRAWVVTGDRALLTRLAGAGVTALRPRGGSTLSRQDPYPPHPVDVRATVKNRAPLRRRDRRRPR
jgi:rRNA-processing protein FCF1